MKSVLPFLLCLTALGAQDPVQTTAPKKAAVAPQQKADPAAQKKPDTPAKEAAKPAEPVVPDLHEIIIKPISPMKMVTQRYELDRGNLNRTYTVAQSVERQARLGKFYGDWAKATQNLDSSKLNETARTELQQLRDMIKRQQRELDQQVKGQAEVAGLVPFGAAIVSLEDGRRRMERLDSEKAAGVLTEVIKEIGKSHKAMEANLAKDAKTPPPSSTLRNKAADSVRDLRTALRNWHGFYDGYDPMFMWWIGEPYKVADKSLQDYIARFSERRSRNRRPATPRPEPRLK